MRKISKFGRLLALSLSISMLFSITALADEHDEEYYAEYYKQLEVQKETGQYKPKFIFSKSSANLAPGDAFLMPVFCAQGTEYWWDPDDLYSAFVVGAKSKDTFIYSTKGWKTGWDDLQIYIGEDETSDFDIIFYLDGTDFHDSMHVHITDAAHSEVAPGNIEETYWGMGLNYKQVDAYLPYKGYKRNK